jgi:predicted transposase YdaD
MAVETLGTFTQSELEYIRETSRIKGELDYQSGMVEARRKGLAEGLAEGRIEGRQEGHNDILDMLDQGLSVEEIKRQLAKMITPG